MGSYEDKAVITKSVVFEKTGLLQERSFRILHH